MSNVFFGSDPHFNHLNIIKFCPETRGQFDNVQEMNEEMIKRHNEKVGVDDIFYCLGDLAFGSDFSFLDRLNGKIRLVRGNHDDKIIAQRPDRFDDVQYMYDIKFGKKSYILCHYRLMTWRNRKHGVRHLFGHTHNSIPSIKNAIDMGYDNPQWGLAPASLEEIEDYNATLPETFPEGFVLGDNM